MKKVIVLKLELCEDRIQRKAMKAVSDIAGVESMSVDKNEQLFTIIGIVDPFQVVRKLRKLCHVELVSVGPPAEEPVPEPEAEPEPDEKEKLAYYNQMRMMQPFQQHYYYRTIEENPNGTCVIC